MKKLSKSKINKAKKLLKKLNMKPNIESKISPIYDEIYFKGIELLKDK